MVCTLWPFIPKALIKWVQVLYVYTSSQVLCTSSLSDHFLVKYGVHQGLVLLPPLHILIVYTIIHDGPSDAVYLHHWALLGPCSMLTMSCSQFTISEELLHCIQAGSKLLSQFDLHFNIKKKEYLKTSPSTSTIQVSSKDLVKPNSFNCLAS